MSYQNDVLMNFRIPRELKSDFETLCYSERETMTHKLNTIIKGMVKEERKSNPKLFNSKDNYKRPNQWIHSLDWRKEILES